MFQSDADWLTASVSEQHDRHWVSAELARQTEDDEPPDLLLVTLSVALPCSMAHCRQPTTRALVEQDIQREGLWSLLPICPSCASVVQAARP